MLPDFLSPSTKRLFYLAGLAYILLLGYAGAQVAADLSPRQRAALWLGYALTAGAYLLAAGLLWRKPSLASRALAGAERFFAAHTDLRIATFGLLLLLPLFLVFTDLTRGVMANPLFRGLVFLPFVLALAFLWLWDEPRTFWTRALAATLALAFVFLLWLQLRWVVDYPFSLTWSEGNRFYDYSLIFGKSIYQYAGDDLRVPYFSPGRYALWGIWFLIPGLPIWFHRLWNAFLWIVPPLLLGWFAGRSIGTRVHRALFAIWVALFISQGPIYTPLVLAAILVVAFDGVSLGRRVLSVAGGSLYAGLSRWTWMAAPGMWGVLLDLGEYHPRRRGNWLVRLWPTVLIGLAGFLPGLLVNAPRFLQPKTATLSLSQPLLWYRMWPNPTYPPGILQGILWATGAVVILLLVLVITRRWRLTPLAMLAFGVAVTATFAVGLVVSMKIGGGSNLHNFDMYLITLVVLVMIYLDRGDPHPAGFPRWMQVILALAVLIPAWGMLRQGAPVHLPAEADVTRVLETLRSEVAQAAEQGEVLFMDQRQLLTFGYITGVDLVPEYEKKYMQDQAMAGNLTYFQNFYDDLAAKRFALIVAEPQHVVYKDRSAAFAEENNVWVQFVTEPLLCYYKPYMTLKPLNIQLLVPRAAPDCSHLPDLNR